MDWLYLALVSLLAATIQSATGFGFGLIAVPVFLLVLDSASAIQMVMIIILCMSIVDWFKLRGLASADLLLWLNIGMLFGFPMGLLIFQQFDLTVLKVLIALLILVFSLHNLFRLVIRKQITLELNMEAFNRWKTLLTGFFSGLMTTSVAMPGPAVMLYLVGLGLDKTRIRATILTFFISAYGGALLLQTLFIGVSASTWIHGFSLLPAALIGVLTGHAVAHRINQKLFKEVVLIILILTASIILWQI